MLNLYLFNEALFNDPGALTISPSGISQAVALGSPTASHTNQYLNPSGIAQALAYGTPTLIYPQWLSPAGISMPIVLGTPSVGVVGIISPTGILQVIAIGSPTVSKPYWHVILDAQYITESPELNRAYVIGRDDNGINVYGSSTDSAELALVGERLDFALELEIPTTALAADVAAAILAKHRLEKARGFLLLPPNCGVELWDVVKVTDTPANQSATKYRISAIRFEYHPKLATYRHKLTLGSP